MALRKIDVSDLDPVPARGGGLRPELRFVPVDNLVIDESYQRAVEKRGWANIKRIAANFDWAKFSPLMVSKRPDGLLAVIDGQHRAHAAALCGIDEVPALVSDLTSEQQASAFSWINGSVTALTPNQIFKAALAAFEPWAVQCDGVVSRAGCRLMPYNKSGAAKQPGEVFAIGMVRRFVEADQSPFLAAVLAGVRDSVVCDDIRYYNGHGLSALVPAAIEAGVTRPEVVSEFLAKCDLEDAERRVYRLLELPEHKAKSFRALFVKSVSTLLKAHVRGAI